MKEKIKSQQVAKPFGYTRKESRVNRGRISREPFYEK
jgi:hypothetical protein